MANTFKKSQSKIMGKRWEPRISCPIVKRQENLPVTLQGWLLKRGSDGLMLWKKRWFVLSDYCLFYYKDTLEEKLLGSLILASYKISQCSPDEKAFKKFSFKAEHANMRTYYFAAENQTLMEQWIKAMTLASLLEENISMALLTTELANNRNDQSDGFLSPSQEIAALSGLRTPDPQPVYANAPPKPKRLNESSSPECSPEGHIRDDGFQNYQNQPYHNVYNNISQINPLKSPSRQGFVQYDPNSADIYGRTSAVPLVKKQENNSAFSAVRGISKMYKDNLQNSKNVSFSFPPRPHSVDFLEYSGKNSSEASHDSSDKSLFYHRPKSSLSRVNPLEEDTWTAEEYARRMRQSSLYVKPSARRSVPQQADAPAEKQSSSPQVPGGVGERQGSKRDPAGRSERVPPIIQRAKNNNLTRGGSQFLRSASARLARPLSDCHDEHFLQNTIGSYPENHIGNPNRSNDPANNVHKEEAMKRLLEWKNRMTQSSLRKQHNKAYNPDRHSSYISSNMSDSYRGGNISTDVRNETLNEHNISTSKTSKIPKKVLNHPTNQIANEQSRNLSISSPSGTFYQFSSDDDGLGGSGSKFSDSGSIVENNLIEKERIKIMVEESNINELKAGHLKLEPTVPLNLIKVTNPIDLSKEKKLSKFDQVSPVCNDIVLTSQVDHPTSNIHDFEHHKSNLKSNFVNTDDCNSSSDLPQSPKNEKDEEWGIKIDESRVIKEFSYHYITSEEDQANRNLPNQDFIDVEASRPNVMEKKTPAKRNEFVNSTSIKKQSNSLQKSTIEKLKKSNNGIIINSSSVRTYRKPGNSLPGPGIKDTASDKRLVQCDFGAFYYDTSSDLEDKIVFDKDLINNPESSSDDERDEEVAAVLSVGNAIPSPAFESDKSNFRKCLSADNLDLVTPSNYPSNETEENIASNQTPSYQIAHEKIPSTSTDVNSDVPEENYIPMTPRKKSNSLSKPESLHSRSNSASHSLIIENLLGPSEECPYVEMTQNGPPNKSSLKKIIERKNESLYNTHDDPEQYCEIGRHKDMQYEMIYSSNAHSEPLYMEVPSVAGNNDKKALIPLLSCNNTLELSNTNEVKDNLSQLKIATLPDILNSTAPPLNPGSGRSDSSDADDEASKDLDSLDAPRHPRFSLSDTFRPASYYLGASLSDRTIIAISTEQNDRDSSDSDLVSPPPIPSSSPPIDDFETSIESNINTKESDSKNIYSNDIFVETNVKKVKPSFKVKSSLRNSNSNLYEASSEESIHFDKKEQRLKRRPLSADILSSLQDINSFIPSPDSDIKSNDQSSHSPYGGHHMELDSKNPTNMKLYQQKNNKNVNYYFVSEDVSNDNDSESDVRFKDDRYIQHGLLYGPKYSTSPLDVNPPAPQNQYENLPISRLDCKYLMDQFNGSKQRVHKEKLAHSNEIISRNYSEQQNNAPYYYSDILFKTDSQNIQKLDKGHWDDNNLINNEKMLTKSDFSKPSATNSMGTPEILSEYSEDRATPDTLRSEINNSSNKIRKEYLKHSLKNEHYSTSYNSDFPPEPSETLTPHRTRSLEGLIDNLPRNTSTMQSEIFKGPSMYNDSRSKKISDYDRSQKKSSNVQPDLWEEDSLWRESLRKVSIRHTRSLEDLDRKDCSQALSSPSYSSEETKMYENLRIAYQHNMDNTACSTTSSDQTRSVESSSHNFVDPSKICHNKNSTVSTKNQIDAKDPKVQEFKNNNESQDGNNSSFEIDREKLRQWDLMSSAPATLSSNRANKKAITERKCNFPPSTTGALSQGDSLTPEGSITKSDSNNTEQPSSSSGLISVVDHEQGQGWNLKVSAGELLGRTHEELVLLLIQLRRQRAAVCQSMEKCHREIESKACLADSDKANRLEHLKKLDELKAKLAELEKQYEKGKPLVNLVDNMVKLGSLYQAGSPQKIEFIQRIQEQRLLAEERRDWERIRPDHHELKAKVERLYRLDKLLQEESGTLHSLQQDKGALERALGGVRNKLLGIHGNSPETEWYKRQQRLLERELSRVRSILALNSKKLEETVAENARLEQELVVLRQKLQMSRRSAEPGSTNTAVLEAELSRVQLLVGDLLRQRQELSLQVRQLTEKSNSLSRQMGPASPVNSVESVVNSGKKNLTNGWLETDLDADVSMDIGSSSSISQRHQPSYSCPLYVNTTDRDSGNDCNLYQDDLYDGSPLSARSPDCSRVSESFDEEFFKQSYGLHLKEKPQEIKTVRIVKRESERRQRDRDRSGNIGIPITYTNPKRPLTDDRFSDKSKSEKDPEDVVEPDLRPNDPPPTPGPRSDSMTAVWNMVRKNTLKGRLASNNAFERDDPLVIVSESPQLSPVYLSETARKIVEEVAWQGMTEKRLMPKEKRRHHTMSGASLAAPQNWFSQMGSRDDLDIERVLRPRLTTPDVVRSTLIRVDPHYTKETIDNILGAPGKIVIPERYIPESQPQLSLEEQSKRSKKADAIRRMLCETTASVPPKESGADKTSSLKRKVAEEKKNREHLLQLSQILAHQVMEKSKIVAGINPTTAVE